MALISCRMHITCRALSFILPDLFYPSRSFYVGGTVGLHVCELITTTSITVTIIVRAIFAILNKCSFSHLNHCLTSYLVHPTSFIEIIHPPQLTMQMQFFILSYLTVLKFCAMEADEHGFV